MKSRSAVAMVALAILVLGVPVSAQDETTPVAFDGIGFAFGPDLGASVASTRVPGQSVPSEPVSFAPDAAHVTFTLYGAAREGRRPPRIGWSESTVRAYRIADLADHEGASAQVAALQGLLADPDSLPGFMEIRDDGGDPLPHLPVDTAAAQAIRARVAMFDTATLEGIAYVVGYRQDVSAFAAGDFWYTFQALSKDGAWYVSGDFVVEAPGFPEQVRPRDQRGIDRRWERYLADSVSSLNAATPDAFSPSLASIDALIESITLPTATTS